MCMLMKAIIICGRKLVFMYFLLIEIPGVFGRELLNNPHSTCMDIPEGHPYRTIPWHEGRESQ